MTDCNSEPVRFPSCKGRLVEASFSGGAITSDSGAVLLRQADRMLGLTERAAKALTDTRRKASCRHWWPNQYRLLLSAMAYELLEAIRRIALAGGELANTYVGTIRLKLLKIGAVVLRNTRRVRLLLSGSCPRQALFHTAAARLQPG